MIALLLWLSLTAADAQQAIDRLHCWAYPRHERCQPRPAPVQQPVPLPPPPPPSLPIIAPAPAPAPAIAPPQGEARGVRPPKRKPRATKPKYKPAPVRKRLAASRIASWCVQVPKGTTMGQIEMFASLKGVKMTPSHRRQAQACLNSK